MFAINRSKFILILPPPFFGVVKTRVVESVVLAKKTAIIAIIAIIVSCSTKTIPFILIL